MSLKAVLLGLATAGSAYAQSSCRATATVTISDSSDATAIAGCSTYSGSIVVATGLTGGLSLPRLEKLDGDFVASNVSGINSIAMERLSFITGNFNLDGMPQLAQITFPSLKKVGKAISWVALAGIQTVSVGPITEAASLRIENTVLQDLDSFDLASVGDYAIANNGFLRKISSQLGNVTNRLDISGNSQPAVSFPNLIWARNMTFRSCSEVNLPSVEVINGSMSLIGNTFKEFAAPNLTRVGADVNNAGGSLAFADNTQLQNISLPLLKYVGGGFRIANNTELPSIDQFPELETVTGALDFYGNMSKIALPALDSVLGAFNIQSTEDIENDCKAFQELRSSEKIRGKYVCQGKQSKPAGEGSTPTGTASGSRPTNAAGSLEMPLLSAVGVSGALALFAGLL